MGLFNKKAERWAEKKAELVEDFVEAAGGPRAAAVQYLDNVERFATRFGRKFDLLDLYHLATTCLVFLDEGDEPLQVGRELQQTYAAGLLAREVGRPFRDKYPWQLIELVFDGVRQHFRPEAQRRYIENVIAEIDAELQAFPANGLTGNEVMELKAKRDEFQAELDAS